MSLDIVLHTVNGDGKPHAIEAYATNLPHTLRTMADQVMLYEVLWHPWSSHIDMACDLINSIERGLFLLKKDPERYKVFSAKNDWGNYEQFISFLEELRDACERHPRASVWASS
jgi:hypothetical protein